MKICAVDKLVNQNFNVIFVNALQQFWRETKAFQCIGKPKKQNLLLFLNGCKITYTDKNNQTFVAYSGDVVYTPIGSEYKVQLSDFNDSNSHTIRFLILSRNSNLDTATHRYNIENATAQLIVVSFNECEIKRHLYREYALPYENARRGVNTKQKAE